MKHAAINTLCLFCILLPIFAMAQSEDLIRKAESGDAEAQYNLGVMYSKGDGVAQDFETACKWYTKAGD